MAKWLVAFVLTIGVELPVVWFVLRKHSGWLGIVLVCLVANLVTHPVVFFVMPHLFGSFQSYLYTAEIGATLVEAVAYWLLLPEVGPLTGLSASAFANAASLAVGLALYALGWL